MGSQLYKKKTGGRTWTTINWTGSPGASDGLRANIEYDDCHAVAVEVTFLIKIKNNPSSSTDKDHYSLKMGSHGSDSETSALYENPTSYGGGSPTLRTEAPHHGSYHGCSGGQRFNVPAIPINNTKVVGLKYVRWNITGGVHNEFWYDFTGAGAGPWVKDAVLDDTGGGSCGVPPIGGNGCIPGSPDGALQHTVRLNGGDFDLILWNGSGTGGSMVEIEAGTLGGGTTPPPDPGGGTPPPAPNPDPGVIKFYLSGGSEGATNTNPNKSLGGPITTTQISPDTMDNIFDDVGHNISSPETNVRCIYILNSGGTQTFTKVHAYLSETDNFIGLLGGLAGSANALEQVVDDENTKPTGGFTSIYHVPFAEFIRLASIDDKHARVKLLGPLVGGTVQPPGQRWVSTAMNLKWVSARARGQHASRIAIYMARTGAPPGNFHVYLKTVSGDTIIGEYGPTAGTPCSSLPIRDPSNPNTKNVYTAIVLDADDAIKNHPLDVEDRVITVDYNTGDDSNYIRICYLTPIDGTAPPEQLFTDTWNGDPLIEPGYTDVSLGSSGAVSTHYIEEWVGDIYIQGAACVSTGASKPTTYDTGIVLPDIPPNAFVGLWLIRDVPKEAPDSADTKVTLIVEGEYL